MSRWLGYRPQSPTLSSNPDFTSPRALEHTNFSLLHFVTCEAGAAEALRGVGAKSECDSKQAKSPRRMRAEHSVV